MGTFRFAFWGEGSVNLLAIMVNRKQLKRMLSEMKYDRLEWSVDINMPISRSFGRHYVNIIRNGSIIATIRAMDSSASWLYPMMN